MTMVMVVVLEELGAECPGVFDGTEPRGEGRAVLEGLVDRLTVGVVIRDVWTAVGPSDPEVGEELGDALGGHRGTPIGMDGEHAFRDALGVHRLGDEPVSYTHLTLPTIYS